ncbi:replication protein a 32 kda subunit b [Hordeum vulgare]|nr:replication protein a 32 kda subunit b [Hordeum vulgare]
MANPHSSNSELFNGQSILPSVSRSIGTSSIPKAPSSLRPFTVKVELLGMVTNKTLSMDHCTFDLYDGTGTVNVIYSFEGPQDSKDAWSFSNGMYVRVVGRTTSMEQFFQIKAYIVRPIKNFNDVTHHFIYCIYAHIDITRQTRLQASIVSPSSASTVMPENHLIPGQIPEHFNLQQKIFSVLRDPAYSNTKFIPIRNALEHGVSIKLLGSAVDANQDAIMDVVTEQIMIGEIYTTIDDCHFKSSRV